MGLGRIVGFLADCVTNALDCCLPLGGMCLPPCWEPVLMPAVLLCQVDLGSRPRVLRRDPVTEEEWSGYMDQQGRLTDVNKLKHSIFRGVRAACVFACVVKRVAVPSLLLSWLSTSYVG